MPCCPHTPTMGTHTHNDHGLSSAQQFTLLTHSCWPQTRPPLQLTRRLATTSTHELVNMTALHPPPIHTHTPMNPLYPPPIHTHAPSAPTPHPHTSCTHEPSAPTPHPHHEPSAPTPHPHTSCTHEPSAPTPIHRHYTPVNIVSDGWMEGKFPSWGREGWSWQGDQEDLGQGSVIASFPGLHAQLLSFVVWKAGGGGKA